MKISPKLHHAIAKASVLHFDQKRKGDGSPYIMHPFSVAFILSNYTDDEDVIIAGLLHDVLEDVSKDKYGEEQMKQEFGERVYSIVKEVTEDMDPEGGQKNRQTWLARKNKYIENLKNDSYEGLMVAAADKIHNLLSMTEIYKCQGDEIWCYFNAPDNKKLWFYEEVLKVLKERLDNPIVQELENTYNKAVKILLPK